MKWTKDKPTKPGFYFVIGYTTHFGKPHQDDPKTKVEEGHFFDYNLGQLEPVSGRFSTEGWRWFYGPVKPPKFLG